VQSAKENFLAAAELGEFAGMYYYGLLLDKTDLQRFVWLGRAAPHLGGSNFFGEVNGQMRNFMAGTGSAKVVLVIGRALKGQIAVDKRLVFGTITYEYDSHIRLVKQALHFYNFQLQSYRRAVDSWTLVGIRLGVVKDLRKMIGDMIWGAREEAKYELNYEDSCL
jgi:hypothetical protein